MAFKFYGVAPKIPIRYKFTGNNDLGKTWIGFGNKLLHNLKRNMGVNYLTTGNDSIKFNNGVRIACSINFGLSSVHIHVPLIISSVPLALPDKSIIPLVFYYQIYNDGNVSADGEYAHASLTINRIIIWKPLFIDGVYSRGNGSIILDVEVNTDTIYHVDQSLLTEEEELAILELANAYASAIDPSIELSNRTPPDHSEDWFNAGPMSSPIRAYEFCAHLENRDEIELPLDTPFIGINSNEWWPMIEAYTGDSAAALLTWRQEWCPDFDGDQDKEYTSNQWPSLTFNANYYPNYTYRQNYVTPGILIACVSTGYECDVGYEMQLWKAPDCSGYPEWSENPELKVGKFFTGNNDYAFPCFFALENRIYPDQLDYYYFHAVDSAGDVWTGGNCMAYTGAVLWHYSVPVGMVSDEDDMITTPLERLSIKDIASFKNRGSAGICNDCECFSEISCDFEVNLGNFAYPGSPTYSFREYMPCDVGDALTLKKESIFYDDSYISQISIPETVELDNNFMALVIHKEYGSQTRTEYRGLDYHYYCNGVDLGTDVTAIPSSYGFAVGVIIYILTPTQYWEVEVDESTGEETFVNFWDIHTHREGSGVLNSNRCLELEEHVNSILHELKTDTESNVDIPHYNDDLEGCYNLLTYSYELFSGFTVKL